MSEKDDPLFPPEWGWQRYEGSVQEDTAQSVRCYRQRHQLTSHQIAMLKIRRRLWSWMQLQADRLPTREAVCEKDDRLDAIRTSLFAQTMRQYDEGTLAGGHDHEAVDLTTDWVPWMPNEVEPLLADGQRGRDGANPHGHNDPDAGETAPLFRPEWGWDRYEETFRERAAQIVRMFERQDEMSSDELNAYWEKSFLWICQQEESGRLPTFDEMDKILECWAEFWRRLLAAVRQELRNGTLVHGHDLETIDLGDLEITPLESRGTFVTAFVPIRNQNGDPEPNSVAPRFILEVYRPEDWIEVPGRQPAHNQSAPPRLLPPPAGQDTAQEMSI